MNTNRTFVFGGGGLRGFAALAPIALAALLSGCATNPVTGETDVVLMSEGAEVRKGREMHEALLKDKTAVYEDEKLQAYVNRVGQRVAASSARPDIEYSFTVLDNQDINAFAFPGGYIYINRGLLHYLDSEAELAAVLAHEVGHVTARHAVRQQSAQVANRTLAQLAYVLTGSGDLAAASNQFGTSLVRGYGREHELEADREGAAYLSRAGYDPNAMLEVIGVLKDQEQYERSRAQQSGRKPRSYHGLFSTHPRHDRRLQEVIRAARELEAESPLTVDPAEFRTATEGLAYGKSSTSAQRQENRYYNERMGFTFAYPEEWSVDPGRKAIAVRNADGSATLTLSMARKNNRAQDNRDFLGEKLSVERLFRSTPLAQSGLAGHTGVTPPSTDEGSRRLAVLERGGIAYLFEGKVADENSFDAADLNFLEVLESFRPMKRSERQGSKQQHLHWVQADAGTTYARLARGVRIPDAENQLRLLNGDYPAGEPAAGEWIKIIRR